LKDLTHEKEREGGKQRERRREKKEGEEVD